jgi:hypothetical protein
LIMRDATTGVFTAATSRASCSPIGPWAAQCAPENVGAPGLVTAVPWLSTFTAAASNVKMVVGDYDRDGRDDVIAMVKNATGNAFKVFGIRAKTDGTFADSQQLWDSGTMAFADVTPTALNVNSDGMADLALLVNVGGTTNVQWLKTVERTAAPASMTNVGQQSMNVTLGPGLRLF